MMGATSGVGDRPGTALIDMRLSGVTLGTYLPVSDLLGMLFILGRLWGDG